MKRKLKKSLHYFGEFLVKTSQTFFYVSAFTWLVYFALENFKTGLISNYFDLNLLLVFTLTSGLVIIIFQDESRPAGRGGLPYLFSLILAILTALILYQNLGGLEEKGIFLSALVGIGVFIILNLFRSKID